MVFSALTFVMLFLPCLLLFYYLVPEIHFRNGLLIIFSLVFYAWGEPVYVILMVLSTLINYLCGLFLGCAERQGTRRLILTLGVIASLGLLFYFKYAGFLLDSLGKLFSFSVPFQAPSLPIGISFYTFQIVTYTVDVYRKKTPVQRNFFRLLLYVSCFPQLIAGPIVQYGDIEPQLLGRTVTGDKFTEGMRRFFLGLAKKVLLANLCGEVLENCLSAASPMTVAGAWLGGLLYSLQLYYDFSAYSDMAIGLGTALGFTYKENFNYPYIALSPSDFWRRWHISLGSFFRDYVYIPLGGNRRGRARTVFNLFVVWALTGLWHGASWNFVLWGMYWFILQQADKAVSDSVQEHIPKLLRRFVTLLLAVIGWVFFYYTDMHAGLAHISAMFGAGGAWISAADIAVLKKYALFLPVAVLFMFPIVPAAGRLMSRLLGKRISYGLGTLLAVLAALLAFVFLVGQTYNPFIYFRF